MHPLDRPIWNALTTRQKHLSIGGARALRFAPEYGLFAAAADASAESLAALVSLIPKDGAIACLEADELPIPAGATVFQRAVCHQLTANRMASAVSPVEIVPLTDADASEMLALATLTEPGPFFTRTHELGGFIGVKQAGRLIAMAGERMKPAGFTEVSGVCTHPDHRGKGYASALIRRVAAGILARGETPFLHAYATNTGAIELYRSLGFVRRREIVLTVLRV